MSDTQHNLDPLQQTLNHVFCIKVAALQAALTQIAQPADEPIAAQPQTADVSVTPSPLVCLRFLPSCKCLALIALLLP